MEFHIHRELRERLGVDERLFSYTGNVVFANVTACRQLAQKMNEARGAERDPAKTVNAGALFAMGLIDELSHALVAKYRKEMDPAVMAEAVKWFGAQVTPAESERLLLRLCEQFPNVRCVSREGDGGGVAEAGRRTGCRIARLRLKRCCCCGWRIAIRRLRRSSELFDDTAAEAADGVYRARRRGCRISLRRGRRLMRGWGRCWMRCGRRCWLRRIR